MPSISLIPVSLRRLVIFTLVGFVMKTASAQRIYVNTSNMVYEVIYANGQCTLEKVTPLCDLSLSRTIYSIAIYQDTLYYNSGKNLFRVVPGKSNSCELVTVLPGTGTSYNCMAADKYGRIFTIEFNSKMLFMYDPATGRLDSLGQLPVAPAGDLMFYKGKLLYASFNEGIYEIDMTDPARSRQYMPTTGYSFYGLLSFPYNCDSNKVYGISLHAGGTSTDLIELDLDRKLILSKFYNLPYVLFDAASSVDNGNTMGLSIDSVELTLARCNSTKGSDAHFLAFTAVQGPVNFILDGGVTNKDGWFTNLSAGEHSLRLENSKGCTFDTVFTVTPVKDPKPGITIITEDQTCSASTGTVNVQINGAEHPYEINFNNEGFKKGYYFQQLNAARYPIIIRNKNHCTWDTFAVVKSGCDTLFMPNAFTPNGDGKNDLIRPVFGSSMGEVNFMVYNRFGQKVFESVGPTKGWDGRMGGSEQPTGSYAYIIKYKSISGIGKFQKGTFILIR